jgi:hypothetical protein
MNPIDPRAEKRDEEVVEKHGKITETKHEAITEL